MGQVIRKPRRYVNGHFFGGDRHRTEYLRQGPGRETGLAVARAWAPFAERPPVDDVLARQLKPHLLALWEPLATKAPKPPKATPYCCYLQTVIFYAFPNLTLAPRGWRDRDGMFHRDSGGRFFEWDRVEHRLMHDVIVAWPHGENGTHLFGVTSGGVVWKAGRWWFYALAHAGTTTVERYIASGAHKAPVEDLTPGGFLKVREHA
jgi:hypothetical protein